MKLVCWTSNPYETDLNCAVLDLDIDGVDRLLRMIDRVKRLAAEPDNDKALCVTYSNDSVEYFANLDPEFTEFSGDEWKELPDGVTLEEEPERGDAPTVLVTVDAVYWQAYERQGDSQVETPTLEREELEELKAHMLASSGKKGGEQASKIATKPVTIVTVIDPDTYLPVEVEIRKLVDSGGMVGIDGSFLEQDVGPIYSPYDKGTELDIPDNEHDLEGCRVLDVGTLRKVIAGLPDDAPVHCRCVEGRYQNHIATRFIPKPDRLEICFNVVTQS